MRRVAQTGVAMGPWAHVGVVASLQRPPGIPLPGPRLHAVPTLFPESLGPFTFPPEPEDTAEMFIGRGLYHFPLNL